VINFWHMGVLQFSTDKTGYAVVPGTRTFRLTGYGTFRLYRNATKKEPSGTKRRANRGWKPVRPMDTSQYFATDAGFDCPKCGDRVWIVHDRSQKYLKGAYCQCGTWAGSRPPMTKEKWLEFVVYCAEGNQ